MSYLHFPVIPVFLVHSCVFPSFLRFPVIPAFSRHSCVFPSFLRRQESREILFSFVSKRLKSLLLAAPLLRSCVGRSSIIFFDTLSCRQESKVYITLLWIAVFSVFSSVCHTCVGRYPVFSLTHPAAGRKVKFALHSTELLFF